MIIKSNIQNTQPVSDPLAEALEKTLPTFARKLKINHYSPTQFAIPDAAWLFKYVFMDQKMRRELLPSNAAMEAGKIVGEVRPLDFPVEPNWHEAAICFAMPGFLAGTACLNSHNALASWSGLVEPQQLLEHCFCASAVIFKVRLLL